MGVKGTDKHTGVGVFIIITIILTSFTLEVPSGSKYVLSRRIEYRRSLLLLITIK